MSIPSLITNTGNGQSLYLKYNESIPIPDPFITGNLIVNNDALINNLVAVNIETDQITGNINAVYGNIEILNSFVVESLAVVSSGIVQGEYLKSTTGEVLLKDPILPDDNILSTSNGELYFNGAPVAGSGSVGPTGPAGPAGLSSFLSFNFQAGIGFPLSIGNITAYQENIIFYDTPINNTYGNFIASYIAKHGTANVILQDQTNNTKLKYNIYDSAEGGDKTFFFLVANPPFAVMPFNNNDLINLYLEESNPFGTTGATGATGPAGISGNTVIDTWSNYPAISDVQLNNHNIYSGTANSIIIGADRNFTALSKQINITADNGIDPLATQTINLLAQNGGGGAINLTANPGLIAPFPGKIALQANGGQIVIDGVPYTVGGVITLDANTGSGGLYTLTSAIKMSAAGINSYAGAIPSVGSLAGYNFIYGTAGVSLCAGLPASGVQFPGTVYIYGTGVSGAVGGVRLQSPSGIQLLSDTYVSTIYPLTSTNLTIQGRSSFPGPEAHVDIFDVDNLTMRSGSTITADTITAVGTNVKFSSPISTTSIIPNGATLNIKGTSSYLVSLSNVSVINLDSTGSGAITGVQTINGSVYPPPDINASLWSTFPAVQDVNIANYNISNVSTITGGTNPLLIKSTVAELDLQGTTDAYLEALNGSVNLDAVLDVNIVAGTGAVNIGSTKQMQIITESLNVLSANVLITELIASGNVNCVNVNASGNVNTSTLVNNGNVNIMANLGDVNIIATSTTDPTINISLLDNTGIININPGGVGGVINLSGIVEMVDTQFIAQNFINIETQVGDINLIPYSQLTKVLGGLDVSGSIRPQSIIDSIGSKGIGGQYLVVSNTNGNIVWENVAYQQISQSGNNVFLTNGGNVDISNITAVANNTKNLNGVVYNDQLLITQFSNPVDINSSLTVGSQFTPASVNINGILTPTKINDSVGSQGNANYVLSAGASGNSLVWVPQATFKYGDVIFVDAINGNNANNGGITSPVQTIAQGLILRNALPDTVEVSVFVAAGSYNESLTITRNNTFLCGFNSSGANKSSVNITGTITVNITSATAPTQLVFSDFQLNGSIVFLSTNINQAMQYSFENINFTNVGTMININNAGGVFDATRNAFINNCVFNNTTNGSGGSITAQKIFLTITNSQFYSTNTGPALAFSNASSCVCRFSSFISNSFSPNAYPLVQFLGSYTGSSITPSFESCIFRYIFNTTDISGNKCCIQFGGTTTITALIYNNILYCEGATTGGLLIQAIQKTGTGAITVQYYGNSCGPTAFNIAPTITKVIGASLT